MFVFQTSVLITFFLAICPEAAYPSVFICQTLLCVSLMLLTATHKCSLVYCLLCPLECKLYGGGLCVTC